MAIDFNEVRQLLGAIALTNITEFTLKSEEFELTVRQNDSAAPRKQESAATEAASYSPPPPNIPTISPPPAIAPPPPPPPAPSPSPLPTTNDKWIAITSPMVGTFYRAPAPGEASFVEIKDRITQGQTVCIIEAMKLMNEIEAETSGQVVEIIVENGEPVEYGQTLMWVDPG